MEGGAQLLWHRFVGCISNQHVNETEPIIARKECLVRLDELVSGKRNEAGPPVGSSFLVPKLHPGTTVEGPSLDRGALDHRPIQRIEPVDAGGEQRVDRRRNQKRALSRVDIRIEGEG